MFSDDQLHCGKISKSILSVETSRALSLRHERTASCIYVRRLIRSAKQTAVILSGPIYLKRCSRCVQSRLHKKKKNTP